jgi:radical SAM superfamily enzyme
VNSVKIHNLYVATGTKLAEIFASGELTLPTLAEYTQYVVRFLEALDPSCVIDRLTGSAPPPYLVAPRWCSDKSAVRRRVEAELERRDSWQGRKFRSFR